MAGLTARHVVALVATAAAASLAACGQDAAQSAGERGERAFGANCAACHGGDLGGTSLGPSLLGAGPADLTDVEIRSIIRNGVDENDDFSAMPGNSILRDTQVAEIIAYIRLEQAGAADS